MTPDEAIAKLRGLPEDKQRQVLAALGPDERKDILGKLTAPEQPKPEARTVGNYLKEGASGVGRGLKNDVVGMAQMLTHPRESASQFAVQAMAAPRMAAETFKTAPGTVMQRGAAAALRGLEEAPVLGPMVQHAEQGGDRMGSPEAFGAAMEGVTTLEAPDLFGRGVAKFIKKAPDMARVMTATSPKVVGDLVKQTKAGNEAADSFSALRSSIETAREKSLKEGNSKYSGVNAAMSKSTASPDFMGSAIGQAETSLRGSTQDTTLLKNMTKEYLGENGRVPTYADLQGEYSRLGNELSKGSLPGDVFHAYDVLHEAIGNEMQRLADQKGQGAALTEARNYWRRMKQTFGKPLAQPDAATATLHSLAPDLAQRDTIANRIRMLGSFDPKIPEQFERMTQARDAAKDAPPVNPGETKKIGTDDIRQKKLKSLNEKGIPRVRQVGHRMVSYGIGLKALWDAFHLNIGSVAEDAGIGYAGYKGADMFAKMLENPKVQKMLTEPTPADIAQIPTELRGQIDPMIKAAQKRGINVSPALIKFGQGAAVVGNAKKKGVAAALQAK